MSKTIKLRKGFDINLAGKAKKQVADVGAPTTCSIRLDDFAGLGRPKLLVSEGTQVKAGTPLFFDKAVESVQYCAPVSGEVVAVVRGDKRKLLEVRILADKQTAYEAFKKHTVSEITNLSKDEAKSQMLQSGVWPQIIQRPYGVVAHPDDTPKSIFVSTFDTHPLAPDYDFVFAGQEKYFQAGIDILKKFTKNGSLHVNLNGNAEVSKVFGGVKNAQLNRVSGPHPAGNVGVQIHHIDPINKGDIVWTVTPYGVIQIGKLFVEGLYDASKVIAVAGSEVINPQYYKSFIGAQVSKYLKDNVKPGHQRVISGNVLTGQKLEADGYLGFYDQMITVIPEAAGPRFVLTDGWLAPVKERLSFHRALGLLSFLNGSSKEYRLDTSTNGEERAFVMTGTFEEVVPMDLYPTYLLKSIMAQDYDEMEALGIYEVVEEDLALCEFVDVSKHDVQALIRQGINLLREA